jgi:hypothetical protein
MAALASSLQDGLDRFVKSDRIRCGGQEAGTGSESPNEKAHSFTLRFEKIIAQVRCELCGPLNPTFRGLKSIVRASRAIMPQIVHGPTVLNDEKRDPFGIVLGKKYPYPENQGDGFDGPKKLVEDLFMTGSDFIVGDVLKELPHILI